MIQSGLHVDLAQPDDSFLIQNRLAYQGWHITSSLHSAWLAIELGTANKFHFFTQMGWAPGIDPANRFLTFIQWAGLLDLVQQPSINSIKYAGVLDFAQPSTSSIQFTRLTFWVWQSIHSLLHSDRLAFGHGPATSINSNF